MKLKFIALALVSFSFAACQSNDIQKTGELNVPVLQQQNPAKTLTSYQWYLDTGANKDMVLSFNDSGRLSIATSCNSLGSDWKISANNIQTGMMMSTAMACGADAMKQEQLAKQFFDKATLPFVMNLDDSQAPTLTLVSASGERHVFTGKMTAEAKYQSKADTIFLEVSPETKACTGVTAQTCLQVKEIKYNQQGIKTHQDQNWSLFYDSIDGFQHTPNERQVIRVKRYTIQNPAADQSKYAYVFDMTVERESIKSSL